MLGKIRTLVGDLANVVTLGGLVGTVGVSGILGIVGPTILQPILGLPAGLRVALGVCIFLAALVLILASLKALLERQSRDKSMQGPTPQSSDWQLWQEVNRVRAENEQLRSDNERLQTTLQKNEKQIAKMNPYVQRIHLRWALEAAWRQGNELREEEPSDLAAVEKWVSVTSGLVRKRFDDETADFFLIHDGDTSFNSRLHRLEQLFDKALDPMEEPNVSDLGIT